MGLMALMIVRNGEMLSWVIQKRQELSSMTWRRLAFLWKKRELHLVEVELNVSQWGVLHKNPLLPCQHHPPSACTVLMWVTFAASHHRYNNWPPCSACFCFGCRGEVTVEVAPRQERGPPVLVVKDETGAG
ncbi:hypothetical protein DPEC_G00263460 [Dallia pectoralis]|uniref:Uncharacterized protein n=1 Tax=Dallia pectoralis TaxID=75939 RepID=A0ACC2FSC6_DALPE|nr:hypothetical protein DPEC_G00263460 [Dallia pectoralis]